jgi:hypothetical protein
MAALTFDEYAERIAAGESPTLLPQPADGARRRRWVVGILGGTNQKGRWRLERRLWIVCVLGGATLDVGQAEPDAPESVITVIAFFGGADITAPPGVPVELTGVSLLGGKSDERPRGPALPGCPLVRVRVFCALGGVKVTAPESTKPSG